MPICKIPSASDEMMTLLEVNSRYFPVLRIPNYDQEQEIRTIPEWEAREDDILICAYPKSGTHWIWEVVGMLLSGKPDRIPLMKESAMLEGSSKEHFDELKSPRILNTHLLYKDLPKSFIEKKCKQIYILRHPKDVSVSFYNHHTRLLDYEYTGTWKNYLNRFIEGKVCFQCIEILFYQKKKKLAVSFNLTFRYIDDVLSINNDNFHTYVNAIYPSELEIKDTTESSTHASYLDILLNINTDGKLATKLYDKRDDFGFPIVNFPHLSSNIPQSPAYGVYISQMIRYARACTTYEDFIYRVDYGSWCDYVLHWDKEIGQYPSIPVHTVTYEDMKANDVEEIKRLANFLNVEISDDLVKNIADNCTFTRMKKDKDPLEDLTEWKDRVPGMYRKGEVGDWKNWFTVSQSEKFDSFYKGKLKGSNVAKLYGIGN